MEMPPFDGEVPERWKRLTLPSLRAGQDHVKQEDEEFYDAPGSPVKTEAVGSDDKKVDKAFQRLMAADAPESSGAYAMDVKESKPQKRPHANDRLQSTAAKRRYLEQAAVASQPVATKASKPSLEGPLADRKLSDVDGIDDFMVKRMLEKVFEV